jgi:hypothetical protein
MTQTPPLRPRPKLHGWLAARGLGGTDLAQRWGITPQGASRFLLPFGNVRRIVPDENRIADVLEWTSGEVGAADWYPAELTRMPMPASVGNLNAEAAQ